MIIQRLLAKGVCTAMLCVLFTHLAFSQTKTITGKITDDKGGPVQGASVTAKGSKGGVTTGADGSYRITVSNSATTLVITYVGFTQKEVSIGDQTAIDVSLVPSNQALSEVVVIGYGTTRKKDLTGSVVSVQSKDFNKGVIAAPDQLLTGKVAGMEVSVSSGQPGAATVVKIRGNNSIRAGNDPLYVIDGVPLDGRAPIPNLQSSTAIPPPGVSGLGNLPGADPLIYINPNDIQSIDVLKDASAAAIYGSRGANGVILFTTKKGSANSTRLDAGASVGVSGLMRQPDILNAGQYRAALKTYGAGSDSGLSLNPFKEITQHGVTQTYNVALSGGSENGRYRASFLAFDQKGLIKTSELQKYLANINGQHKYLDKRLSVDFNLTASNFTLAQPPISNDAGSTGNLISAAMNWNPTLYLVNPDGTYNQANPSGQINPLAILNAYYDQSNVTTILGNISGSVKITPDLEYKMLYGVNYGAGSRNNQMLGWIRGPGGNTNNGQAFVAQASLFSQTITHTLTYNKKLSDLFTLNAVAGYEYWSTRYKNQSTYAYGFDYNLKQGQNYPVQYFNNMQDANPSNTVNVSAIDPTVDLQSYFGRVVLNYNDLYLLTATIRADGSSKFGTNNRYAYFPSLAAAWNISNEAFMKDNTIFSNLKLRLGWGKTGNQQFPAGAAQNQFEYTANGSLQTLNFANPALKWETVTSYDGGLDFSLLHGRIFGYFDYYHKKTTDPLFNGTVSSPSPGTGSLIWQNLPGYITNKGYEISLGGDIVSTQDVKWTLIVNASHNSNVFKYPAIGTAPLFLTGSITGQGTSNTFVQAIANNHPVAVFYTYQFQGFDQNGITQLSKLPVYAGNPNPAWIIGITTEVSYKKIALTLNLHGAYDYMIYNNTLTNVTNLGNITNGKNIAKSALGTAESPADYVASSTRFLYSGNYMKMGNATLSYHFGDIVGNHVRNTNVFFTVTNLFEITKYKGFDAEVNTDHNNNGVPSIGIDYIGYPTARTFTLGLNFSL